MISVSFGERLKALPRKPGVYLLKDEADNILYVGKAVDLHQRVSSYFGSAYNLLPKLQRMVAKTADFEFFLTDSEQEAILLECNLIKKYRPRYNVRLKDDKSYPYLKINPNEDWAGVYITRRLENDGARYFGPFASAGSVRKTLSLLRKLFPFRSCHKPMTGNDLRPCLEYHIHRCLGPCIGAVSQEEYHQVIKQVILFLEGKQEIVVRELRAKMEEASENLEFEKAALLRDQIQAVEQVVERQKIAQATGEQDVIAFARARDQACVQVFFIRNGKLLGREHFIIEGTQDEEPAQIMASFLKQFYHSAPYLPPVILLQHLPQDQGSIKKWLESKRGGEVKLHRPRRGVNKELVDMVAENACQWLEQLRIRLLAEPEAAAMAIEELQQELHLPCLPQRVECYDISDICGTSAVGSMVVFERGQAKRSQYRRFRIKTVAGANDYAMIQEVLRRRFKRSKSSPEEGAWGTLPDLVLIDGGKGQLNAALEATHELGVSFIPCASLAKENEEVFLPQISSPIILPPHSAALCLLQRMRDEAHRFAIGYYHRLHCQEAFASTLDAIPGIGPKRKRALLKKFGSVKAIREASADELAQVEGVTKSAAEKVKEYL